MSEEIEIQLSEKDCDQAVTDEQLPEKEGDQAATDEQSPEKEGEQAVTDEQSPEKDGEQAVTDEQLPDLDSDQPAEEMPVFHSFADGATDSANVLDIPEPVQNHHKTLDTEFIVGAAVLSAVGGIFLLIALVLVWVNYMNGFLKGMSMYLISIALLCVSELLIRKVQLKLSYVLTSVGISGFYASTMVNSRWLDHFPETIGLIIIAVFSVLILLYSWARNVPWYRIVSLLAFYFCLSLGRVQLGDEMYFTTIFFGLSVSLLGALIPIKGQGIAVTNISMLAMALWCKLPVNVDWLGMIQEMIYCMGAMLILSLLLYRQLRLFYIESQNGAESGYSQDVGHILCLAVYLVSLLFLYLRFNGAALIKTIFTPALHFCMLGIGGACLVSFTILWKYREKWFIYLWGNIFAYTTYLTLELRGGEDVGWGGWCLVILLLVSELLAFCKVQVLRVNQAAFTVVACITVTAVSGQAYVYALLAVLLTGFLLVNHWHAFYELIVTYTVAWFVTKNLPIMLSLPVFAGILFVGILLVNNKKWLRDRMPLIYNWGTLSGLIAAYLFLLMPLYRNYYLMYFCMLILGLSIIILILDEKYHLNCKCKLLVAELFLDYLVLTMYLNPPVIASILLMAIALAGVGCGFWLDQKSARICGLLFSLLVCGKIVLYDFRGGSTIHRILLFLVTGAIALMIGGLYIILEKKMSKNRISQLTGGGE